MLNLTNCYRAASIFSIFLMVCSTGFCATSKDKMEKNFFETWGGKSIFYADKILNAEGVPFTSDPLSEEYRECANLLEFKSLSRFPPRPMNSRNKVLQPTALKKEQAQIKLNELGKQLKNRKITGHKLFPLGIVSIEKPKYKLELVNGPSSCTDRLVEKNGELMLVFSDPRLKPVKINPIYRKSRKHLEPDYNELYYMKIKQKASISEEDKKIGTYTYHYGISYCKVSSEAEKGYILVAARLNNQGCVIEPTKKNPYIAVGFNIVDEVYTTLKKVRKTSLRIDPKTFAIITDSESPVVGKVPYDIKRTVTRQSYRIKAGVKPIREGTFAEKVVKKFMPDISGN